MRSTPTELAHQILFAIQPDQVRKHFEQDLKDRYRESYEEAKTDGVIGILNHWCWDLRKDVVTAFEHRVECGQGRQLAVLGMSLALVCLATLYSGFTFVAGLLSFALFGLELHGQIASSAALWSEAQIPVYAANIVPALLFVGIAWGTWRFAKKMYADTIISESA